MEAALSGCLMVLNGSVPSLTDIVPANLSLVYTWGTDTNASGPQPDHVAGDILRELEKSAANRSKRSLLKTHSWDAVQPRLLQAVSA